MIFKRLLSNLIDIVLYFIVLFLFLKLSGQEPESAYLNFFYFISFIVTFVFPVVLLENTFGKQLVKLKWKSSPNLKPKLCIKYFTYYAVVAPGIAIFSAIFSFPYLNDYLKEFSQSTTIVFTIIYVLTDVIVFLFSIGRFRILDYLMELKIDGHEYLKNPLKVMGITYLFFGLWFLVSVYSFKYDMSFKSIEKNLSSVLYKEQYPSDLFYGNYVITTKNYSENVFTPSKPFAFLHPKKLSQKTLYLNLPEQVFNSESERKNVCLKLIVQSYSNDTYADFEPVQTRIVLSSSKRGFFFENYYYRYTYYFDNQLPQWSVFGGFKADSLATGSYTNFINNYNKSLVRKIDIIEKQYDLTWKEIVERSEIDDQFEREIMGLYSSGLSATTFYDRVEIYLDTVKLELNKIEFTDTKLNGYMNFGFPITNPTHTLYSKDFIDGESMEYDDNIESLKFLRQEVINNGI